MELCKVRATDPEGLFEEAISPTDAPSNSPVIFCFVYLFTRALREFHVLLIAFSPNVSRTLAPFASPTERRILGDKKKKPRLSVKLSTTRSGAYWAFRENSIWPFRRVLSIANVHCSAIFCYFSSIFYSAYGIVRVFNLLEYIWYVIPKWSAKSSGLYRFVSSGEGFWLTVEKKNSQIGSDVLSERCASLRYSEVSVVQEDG